MSNHDLSSSSAVLNEQVVETNSNIEKKRKVKSDGHNKCRERVLEMAKIFDGMLTSQIDSIKQQRKVSESSLLNNFYLQLYTNIIEKY
jgi:hypothetical protein